MISELALRYAMQSIAIQEPQSDLLFATAALVLGGTLVVFIWQWWRNRGRDD